MVSVGVLTEEVLLANLALLLEASLVSFGGRSSPRLQDLLGEYFRRDGGQRGDTTLQVVSAIEEQSVAVSYQRKERG